MVTAGSLGLTVVTSETLLSAGVGSLTLLLTTAWLVSSPAVVGVKTTVTLVLKPAGRLPMANVIKPFAGTAPPVAETKLCPWADCR